MSNVQMRTTLPRELATDIDRIATTLGISRYQALRQGARLFVELHTGELPYKLHVEDGELPPKAEEHDDPTSLASSSVKAGTEAAEPAVENPIEEEPTANPQEGEEEVTPPTLNPESGESEPSKNHSKKPANSNDSNETSNDSEPPSSETENIVGHGLKYWLKKRHPTRKP